jgi:hypothetical protein
MLDMIGAIFASALSTAVVSVLIGLAPLRAATRLAAFAAAAAWLAIVVGFAAALGGLAPGAFGSIPPSLLPFGGLLAILLGGWFLVPQVRNALLSVPLPALVGVHAGRLGGLFFLLLYADGRLSAPFALAAGVGDIITGALALVFAAMLAFGFDIRRTWLNLWNAFGILDLVVAITLGLLSAPGIPFRLFFESPGMQVMTTLPWLLVPAALVPIFFLIHIAISKRLKTAVPAGRLTAA